MVQELDVTIYSPLLVKGFSTFENNLSIGTLQSQTENSLTCTGGVLVGGKLRVQGGAIETTQLKVIVNPSIPGADGIELINSSNSMIAKFYDDYRVVLNGFTSILSDLYCSGKIDGYLFTPTEIKQRDTNPLLIKNRANTTSIKIDEVSVDIEQPLRVSSSNSIFSYGIGAGILQPTESLGINCYSSGSFGGNLAVYGTTNLTGNLNIARSDPGGGEVAIGITNNGQSAYSSLYIQTRNQTGLSTNETGQLYVPG